MPDHAAPDEEKHARSVTYSSLENDRPIVVGTYTVTRGWDYWQSLYAVYRADNTLVATTTHSDEVDDIIGRDAASTTPSPKPKGKRK